MWPKVAIVVVNWNGKDMLRRCLDSITAITRYPNYDIIVVDNGSTDGSIEMVSERYPNVKLVENGTNLGFAKANNRGIKIALSEGADYVLLLNNDVEAINKDWLDSFVMVAEENRDVGIVGCKLIFPNGRIQHAGGYMLYDGPRTRGRLERDLGQYDEGAYLDHVSGAAMLIKKDVILSVGLFDEDFSPAYFEEAEFCLRAMRAGYKVMYTHRAVLVHYEGMTAKRQPLRAYYSFHKNRLRFQLAHYPLGWLIRSIPSQAGVILSAFLGRNEQGRFTLKRDGPMRLLMLIRAFAAVLSSMRAVVKRRKLFGTLVDAWRSVRLEPRFGYALHRKVRIT